MNQPEEEAHVIHRAETSDYLEAQRSADTALLNLNAACPGLASSVACSIPSDGSIHYRTFLKWRTCEVRGKKLLYSNISNVNILVNLFLHEFFIHAIDTVMQPIFPLILWHVFPYCFIHFINTILMTITFDIFKQNYYYMVKHF